LLQLERLKSSTLKGITVLAVSPDSPEETNELLARLKSSAGVSLTHRFLSDVDLKAIDAYGIRNKEATKPIPHPTTILIDRDGREVWRFTDRNFKTRPTDAELKQAVDSLNRER
jgi:peroxiredoxin